MEIDLEIDAMCVGHAAGKQVSLAKGGLRVRSRVALNDGAAMILKYNTSITAPTNGSLKLVKRDRSIVEALDNGEVNFKPRAAFDAAAQKEFAEECEDTYVLLCLC